jgi:hypothetical protein
MTNKTTDLLNVELKQFMYQMINEYNVEIARMNAFDPDSHTQIINWVDTYIESTIQEDNYYNDLKTNQEKYEEGISEY